MPGGRVPGDRRAGDGSPRAPRSPPACGRAPEGAGPTDGGDPRRRRSRAGAWARPASGPSGPPRGGTLPQLALESSPMDLERPLPTPITPESRPYWEGARDGKLMIPKCRACGKPFMYPRVACPFCASRDIGWVQATGRGRLFSFEIAHQILNKAFKVKTPVVLAMVELEEGPRILSNLVGIAPDPRQIRCDMPVEVCFEKLTDEISLPMFRPAGGAR